VRVLETIVNKTKTAVVLGAQWGDEGKGKIVDVLSTPVGITPDTR
jgi:adenylosuccinate synthase